MKYKNEHKEALHNASHDVQDVVKNYMFEMLESKRGHEKWHI
jgi:hypothetical protein